MVQRIFRSESEPRGTEGFIGQVAARGSNFRAEVNFRAKPSLNAIVTRITGKRVSHDGGAGTWYQEEDMICTPAGDAEGLLHELGHWIVATDAEREWPNLALDDDAKEINKELPKGERLLRFPAEGVRERQACAFERMVYGTMGIPVPGHSSCRTYSSHLGHVKYVIGRIKALGIDPHALVKELAGVLNPAVQVGHFHA